MHDPSFELLVNSVIDYAIYMLDPAGRIVTWNAGAERCKGYSAHEIIGQHFSRFFTDEDRDAGLPDRALAIAASEGRFEAEGWRQRKDGTRFWANAVLDAIRGPDGQLLGYAKITRDITDRTEAEEALKESELRFELLVNSVTDYAIYMLDPDGIITNWNTGAQAIKGYTREEVIGQHFGRFYTEEDRAAGVPAQALETALRHGKYEVEALRRRKDGALFWAHVLIDPIYGKQGEHLGFAKITRDITERKRNEEELEQARAAMANAQKLHALGELTGGIAHDFNNMMAVVVGSAELLLRKPDLPAEQRTRHLQAILEMSSRATRMTNHLLAYGRRQTIRPEVLDINACVHALNDVLAGTMNPHIEVVLDLAEGLCPVVVDQGELETALLNAVFNARDAMPEGGRLTIRTREVAIDGTDFVETAIEDTGVGMPEEIAERAYDPFFTTKDVGQGTGLGLSQIQGFAAQAGGTVALESAVDEGTTLRIMLPCAKGQRERTSD